MGIQVAQLSIVVEADTGPAAANLNALNAAFQQVASQAAAGAQQEAASEQGVVEAISAVVMAVRAQTAAIQEASAQNLSALDNLSGRARTTGSSVNAMGVSGSQGIMLLNTAFAAAGQPLGQLSNGLFLVSQGLTAIPNQASAVEHGILAMSAAVSAFGAVSAAFGGPMIQQLQNLKTVLANGGQDWSDYSDAVQKAIDKGIEYGNNASKTEHSLAQLAAVTKDQNQLLEAEQAASDVAAHRGQDLSTATDIITRAMEGQSRGLRVLGIDMPLIANVTKNLADANQSLTNAMQAATTASDAYDAALKRYQDGLATAALKADGLAAALQNLAVAEQRVLDLQDKFAAEDLAIHISHETEAINSLADANQHLADVQEKIAVDAEQPQIDKVAEATDHLTQATLRLKDAQDKKIQEQQITPAELEKLAAASDRVLEAQERLADAQGGDIASAQKALREAIDQQRAALDAQAQKQLDAMAQTSGLVSAQDSVKQATTELANAQREAYLESIGQTPQQIQQAHELRDALKAVEDAQKKITVAIAQDQSEALLKQLQRTTELRDANLGVQKAQEGVAQAHRDIAAEAIRQADAYLSVQRAADALATANLKVAEAQDKVAAAQDAFDNQLQRILDAIEKKYAGTADNMANTWIGHLKAMLAQLETWMGDIGNTFGKFLTFAFPLIYGLGILRKAFGGGEGVAGAAAELGDELPGLGGALAGIADGAGALTTMLAGLVLGGILLVDEAISKVTGFDFLDWMRGLDEQLVSAMFQIGKDLIEGLWRGLQSAWNDFTSGVSSLFSSFVSGITSLMGIRSPSRVFHDIGVFMMEGLHEGIKAGSSGPADELMALSAKMASQPFNLNSSGGGLLGDGVAAHLGQSDGQVIVKRDTYLTVQGNVMTERDLLDLMRTELTKTGQGQGGNLFGGYA